VTLGDGQELLVASDAAVVLVGDGDVSVELLDTLVDCAGRQVCLTLEADGGTVVTEVLVTPQERVEFVDAVDTEGMRLTLAGEEVQVMEGASIVDQDTNENISLGDISSDDAVQVFGLEACGERRRRVFRVRDPRFASGAGVVWIQLRALVCGKFVLRTGSPRRTDVDKRSQRDGELLVGIPPGPPAGTPERRSPGSWLWPSMAAVSDPID